MESARRESNTTPGVHRALAAALRLLLFLLLPACAAGAGRVPGAPEAALRAAAPSTDAPYVLVLGTAQDGGLPQIGCELPCCTHARAAPSTRRLVASLLIVDPRTGARWLIDATPDLAGQVERMRGHPPARARAGPRPPLVDGIFLTHAHMGHYLGLAQLGREAYGARDVALLGPASMGDFLRRDGPWSLLFEEGRATFAPLADGETVSLAGDLSVTALAVPHRDELSLTHGYLVRGPSRALLYVPDIDKWERWDRRLEDVLADVDVALLDGTFFADGEIPGRGMADIPHPFVVETIARLRDAPAAERAKVVFTHLNHTNPAADPTSAAAAAVRAAGMRVAEEGEILGL